MYNNLNERTINTIFSCVIAFICVRFIIHTILKFCINNFIFLTNNFYRFLIMGGSNDPNVNENQKDTITTSVKLDQIIIFTNDIKISQNKLINSINSIRDENKNKT